MSELRTLPITIPKEEIEQFCQRHNIRKLSLFGSVLRDDFTGRAILIFWWSLSREKLRVILT
jgi:hypothetical protein